jgi:integrase
MTETTVRKRRKKGTGSVERRADGKYRASRKIGDRRYITGWHLTRADALAALAEKVEQRYAPTPTSKTLSAAFEDFLLRRRHAESTRRAYRSLFNHHFAELHDRTLSSLRTTDFLAVYEALAKQGRSNQTIRQLHATAVGAFRTGVSYGWVPTAWVKDIQLPKGEKVERREGFTRAEAGKIVKALEGEPDELRWLIAIYLGCRPGELRGLTWDEVDLGSKPASIHLRTQIQRIRGEGEIFMEGLKTKAAERRLYLTPTLAEMFWELRAQQYRMYKSGVPRWVDSRGNAPDLVFTQPNGRPLTDSYERRRWKKIIKKAKVDYRPIYALRHTAATTLLSSVDDGGYGLSPAGVALVLGHADTSGAFTQRQYVDVVEGVKIRLAEQMARMDSQRELAGQPSAFVEYLTPEEEAELKREELGNAWDDDEEEQGGQSVEKS